MNTCTNHYNLFHRVELVYKSWEKYKTYEAWHNKHKISYFPHLFLMNTIVGKTSTILQIFQQKNYIFIHIHIVRWNWGFILTSNWMKTVFIFVTLPCSCKYQTIQFVGKKLAQAALRAPHEVAFTMRSWPLTIDFLAFYRLFTASVLSRPICFC